MIYKIFFLLAFMLSCTIQASVVAAAKDLGDGKVDDPNVGNIVSPISFDFVKTNWHRLEQMELDFGVVKLCNIVRKEHHVVSGIVIEVPDLPNSALSVDDLLSNELELAGFECGKPVNSESQSWVDFELLDNGLTEITGTLYINDKPYEIDGKTGELYISVEISHSEEDHTPQSEEEAELERQYFATKFGGTSQRRALLLDEGQLLLQVYVTVDYDLLNIMQGGPKTIVRVIQALEYSYDAMSDLGFEVVIVGMKFVHISNPGTDPTKFTKTKVPMPPNYAHLTYHFGCYPNLPAGGAAVSYAYWFPNLGSTRRAFSNICSPYLSQYKKMTVTHELGHHVGLEHTHEDDALRIGNQQKQYCPAGKESVMSYCHNKKHQFRTSERAKVWHKYQQMLSQGWSDPVKHTIKYCQTGGGYHHGNMINSNSGANTAAQCLSHCNSNYQCKFWDFDGYVCRLRSNDGDSNADGEGVVSDHMGVTYGQRNCRFQCQSGGYFPDAQLIHSSFKNKPWDCRQHCKNTWNCEFWDYRATSFWSGTCRLRSNDGTGPKDQSGDSFDSMFGYKHCEFGHHYRRALGLDSESTLETSTSALIQNISILHPVLICGILIFIVMMSFICVAWKCITTKQNELLEKVIVDQI